MYQFVDDGDRWHIEDGGHDDEHNFGHSNLQLYGCNDDDNDGQNENSLDGMRIHIPKY